MKRPLSATPRTDALAAAFHAANHFNGYHLYVEGKRLIRLARELERDNAGLTKEVSTLRRAQMVAVPYGESGSVQRLGRPREVL